MHGQNSTLVLTMKTPLRTYRFRYAPSIRQSGSDRLPAAHFDRHKAPPISGTGHWWQLKFNPAEERSEAELTPWLAAPWREIPGGSKRKAGARSRETWCWTTTPAMEMNALFTEAARAAH
jgi:hypothetical protein